MHKFETTSDVVTAVLFMKLFIFEMARTFYRQKTTSGEYRGKD
jgi:hypothetical protein